MSYKDLKAVCGDLKEIYNAGSLELAEEALERFSEKWDKKYPVVSKRWLDNWEHLITIFKYPPEIRKVIYTTNAIESLNMVIRKGIRGRRIFPSDASALKIVWMAISQAAKKWTMPVRDWKSALSHFLLMFQNRLEATSL